MQHGSSSACQPSGSKTARHAAVTAVVESRRSGGSSLRQRAGGSYRGAMRRRAGGLRTVVVAISAPERQTVTERTPPPPPPEVDVKVVGIGSRGAHAISKLVLHKQAEKAELWCLDVERSVLEAVPTPNTLLLPKDDPAATEGKLSAADLQRIVGRAASDAGGRGNINAGTDGAITFVLAPAAAAPGGAATVLQVVAALRAAGHFTVAAVTQPFGFEGTAKREQAAELIAALKQTAHVVAVMEQDVLMQAFGDAQMTVAEATNIADTALEHAVLCVLSAVQAEEVLKSSRGALMWHGRDLRHFKRILPPPLQALLTRPGTAVLGRGLASMPAEAAHQMGAAQALMHLASDAVRAAAESPFLEGALDAASGVLCSISLPPAAQAFATGAGDFAALQEMQTPDGQQRALRLAAQAAAGALGSMSGADCQDFVLSAEPRLAETGGGDGSLVQVEATLLVMRNADDQQAPPAAARSGVISRQPVLQQPQGYSVGPAVPPPPRQPQRLPSSSWGMMSAVAGGAAGSSGSRAAGPRGGQGEAPPAAPAPAPPAVAPATPTARQAPAPPPQPRQQARALREVPNFFGGGRPRPQQAPAAGRQQQQQQQTPAAASQAAAPKPQQRPPMPQQQARAPQAGMPQQRVPVQRPAVLASARAAPATSAQAAPVTPTQSPSAPPQAGAELQRKTTVGDYLAKPTTTAQSLDLSPAAARWRQEHRGNEYEQRKLIVWEVEDEPEPWQDEDEEGESRGLAALLPLGMRKEKKVDLKQRMANILSQDREDAWVADKINSDE